MEDALVRLHNSYQRKTSYGLNPCFNGRCTRTKSKQRRTSIQRCLNPCFNGRCTRTFLKNSVTDYSKIVLILVLMEDALVLKRLFTSTLVSAVLILVLMEDALVHGQDYLVMSHNLS